MRFAALLLGAALGCGLGLNPAGAWAGETLTACGDPDYAPFTYVPGLKSGDAAPVGTRIEGVAPDVLRLVFEPLGIKVDAIVQGNWKRCQVAVEDGGSDVLMAAYKGEARMAYAHFTTSPLAPEPTSIFVRKGSEFKFGKPEDLIGKRGGAPSGYAGGTRLDAFFNEYQLLEYAPDSARNYMKLATGRIDFIPQGLYAGTVFLHKMGYGGKILALKNPADMGYTYLPISRKSRFADRLPQLEAALQKLHADGTIDRLIRKHMAAVGAEYPR